ncbi:hypothetical protein [Botrimarina mediterranea]|uniref:Uncharacterized protein n=1 Tax=Botrimarina mediterranea TaxID=2528022 RepID=A0A518KCF0_9BACT|nr:hypothetical protein [Botrimarina mediterranea]QDV75448.1 hypothetical protein Spa11_36650 [Botrimarina mediterranea]QDV80081.1 hypothetical protein K2D_37040 [Planctomycetes bacterium K2D]
MAHWAASACRFVAAVMTVGTCLSQGEVRAQEPDVGAPTLLAMPGESTAYPNGTFGEQLSAASGPADYPVGGPGYRPGAGRRDDWLVGPHWRVTVDGVVLSRGEADLAAILAEVEPIAPAVALPPLEFYNNFDHAAGARVLLTSEYPQFAGYELQVGYLGAEKWTANAYWEEEPITAGDIAGMQRRQLVYDSRFHSGEINFQKMTPGYLKPFAGVRYIAFGESVSDINKQYTNVILPDPDITVPGDSLSSILAQQSNGVEVDNNLIGFQSGLRLDMWRPTRRLHLTGFVSAGVYCNFIDRDRVSSSTVTVTTKETVVDDDNNTPLDPNDDTRSIDTTTNSLTTNVATSADGTRIAFTTEASLAATWRLSNTTALRGGYQAQFLGGVELAENLWTAPPPITAESDELFLHGWFAGIEYRR